MKTTRNHGDPARPLLTGRPRQCRVRPADVGLVLYVPRGGDKLKGRLMKNVIPEKSGFFGYSGQGTAGVLACRPAPGHTGHRWGWWACEDAPSVPAEPLPDKHAAHPALRAQSEAADALLPVVYDELRRLAAARLRGRAAGQTLQPTALVHEAYLRLVKDGDPGWNGRGHFFGAAARAMRNILVERARSRERLKRGGDRLRVDLPDVAEAAGDDPAARVIELDRLVDALDRERPRLAELAMLHLFVGMTHAQIAESLGVSVRTVERDWRLARALMQRELDRPS